MDAVARVWGYRDGSGNSQGRGRGVHPAFVLSREAARGEAVAAIFGPAGQPVPDIKRDIAWGRRAGRLSSQTTRANGPAERPRFVHAESYTGTLSNRLWMECSRPGASL